MRIKEKLRFPMEIVVEVTDFEQELDLRKFIEEWDVRGDDPAPPEETPEEEKRTNGEMLERVPDSVQTDTEEAPEVNNKSDEKSEGFRDADGDKDNQPDRAVMKACLKHARKQGCEDVDKAMAHIYGHPLHHNGRLFQIYDEIWDEMQEEA